MLPQELLSIVLSPSAFTSSEERTNLIFVSLVWYNCIIQCPSVWKSIRLKQDDDAAWFVFPSVGKYVNSVWYVSYNSRHQYNYSQGDMQTIPDKDREQATATYIENKKKYQGN